LWQGHYLTFAVPALCVVYLVALQYMGRGIGRLVQVGLCGAMCSVFLLNVNFAQGIASFLMDGQPALQRDIQAGIPATIVAERNVRFLSSPAAASAASEHLAELLSDMRKAGIPQFTALAPDPVYRELPMPAADVANPIIQATDHPGIERLKFDVGQTQFVYAIRIQGTYEDDRYRRATFRIFWDDADASQPGNSQRSDAVVVVVDPNNAISVARNQAYNKSMTMWVNSSIT